MSESSTSRIGCAESQEDLVGRLSSGDTGVTTWFMVVIGISILTT